jgi:transposase
MDVVIGIDPHKASHRGGARWWGGGTGPCGVRSGRNQLARLLAWAEPFSQRRWAIEGAEGLGFLLAQRLVAAEEVVVDVTATLAARTRLLGHGRTNNNDQRRAVSRSDGVTAPRAAPDGAPLSGPAVMGVLVG